MECSGKSSDPFLSLFRGSGGFISPNELGGIKHLILCGVVPSCEKSSLDAHEVRKTRRNMERQPRGESVVESWRDSSVLEFARFFDEGSIR